MHRREEMKKAWGKFVRNRPVPDGAVRPEIMESWVRCSAQGVDPYMKSFPSALPEEETKDLLRKNSTLITATQGILKSFYAYVNNMDVLIILLDKGGYILEMIGEGPIWTYGGQVVNAVIGGSLNESHAGTNAPSMVLILDKPYEMVAEEHYMQSLHRCLCVAAPVHDASGGLIGVLNMTLTHETSLKHPHTLAMIVALAGIIENQVHLFHSVEETYFVNRSLKLAMASMNDGLVVIGGNDTLVHMNVQAETLLDVKLEDAVNQPVVKIIKNKPISGAIIGREQLIDQEVILKTSPGRPRCLVSLNPITGPKGQYIGSTLLLKEYKLVRNLIHKVVGLKAHYSFQDIWGVSPEIREVVRIANVVANSTSNVIITGDSGTGKELVAQSIHNAGFCSDGPFLGINCAAIPYNLIESEIFGYEAGTFTGGLRQGKPGKLELVKGGTLFLDEINGMSMDMQAKLLRVFDERQFQRLGGNTHIPLEARIISATNQNLLERVELGNFRSDLYYRLSVIDIHIPPLRERKKDIEILVRLFIEEKNRQLGKTIQGITEEALAFLVSYAWPGNVRELKNWIERAVNFAAGDMLSLEDFPRSSSTGRRMLSNGLSGDPGMEGMKLVGLYERDVIKKHLEKCGGNILKASQCLGISRATLYRKMDKHKITLSRNVRS